MHEPYTRSHAQCACKMKRKWCWGHSTATAVILKLVLMLFRLMEYWQFGSYMQLSLESFPGKLNDIFANRAQREDSAVVRKQRNL